MFKTIFIRIITNIIKKTFTITTITLITRIILIIEAIFVSTTKSKLKITFKEFMCYTYNKIDYYKKNYKMQN